MNNSRVFWLLVIVAAMFTAINGFAQTIKEVGDDQPLLKKLSDVAVQVNVGVTANTIYRLNATYDGTTGETFPIIFANSTLYTVTIYVDSAASGRVTSGAPGPDGALIIFSGGGNITFDGRPGGQGISREWSIQHTNSSTAYPTIMLVNGTSNNVLQYLDVQGSSSGLNGVVSIGSGSGANTNNTVSYNIVHSYSGGTPVRGITSRGSSTAVFNSGNIISNNEIYDIFSASTPSAVASIFLDNSGATTISNNSIYWSTDFSASTLTTPFHGIRIGNSVADAGNVISGNSIGGSMPNVGGSQRTFSSTSYFTAIDVENGSATTSAEIQNNTIANLAFSTSYSGNSSFRLIRIRSGNVNVGTSTGNTLGSSSGTGSVVLNVLANQVADLVGISSSSSGDVDIRNNSMGGLTVNVYSDSGSPSFEGIRITNGRTTTIRSNVIGNSTGGNIQINQLSPTGAPTSHRGIHAINTDTLLLIQDDIVQNIQTSTVGPKVDFIGVAQELTALPPSSTVTGNLIEKVHQTGTSSSSFIGILSGSGSAFSTVNLISGNRVDSITSEGSGPHYGIRYIGKAPGTIPMMIANDTIRNLNIAANAGLYAIETFDPAASATIQNNLVTNISMGPSSGDASSTFFTGISCVAGSWAATGNTISNISSTSTTMSGANPAIKGFHGHSQTNGRVVEGNRFFNFVVSPLDPGIPVGIQGITVSDLAGGEVKKNLLHSFSSSSPTGAFIYGIFMFAAYTNQWTISNNMISLGSDAPNNCFIRGIDAAGFDTMPDNYYYNTVVVSGAVGSGGAFTYAFDKTTSRPVLLRDNILVNTRSGGSGTHVAIAASDTTGWNATTSDYNDLYASNASTVASWNGTPLTFAGWKSITGGEAFSKSKAVNFVSVTDPHLSGPSIGDIDFTGTPIGGITTDFDNQTREPSFPAMGADEHPESPLPITLVSFTALSESKLSDVNLTWTTASEVNNYGFFVERCPQGSQAYQTVSELIAGAGTSLQEHVYAFTDANIAAGSYVYRLRQVDLNGDVTYSYEITVTVNAVLGVNDGSEPLSFKLNQNYPNPFNPTTSIRFSITKEALTTLKIYNMLGEEVTTLVNDQKQPGRYTVAWDASGLANGVYTYRLVSGENIAVHRMVLVK